MPAKIIIGGDVVPTKSNWKLFAEGNIDELIGEGLKALLGSADYTVFNLEVPLTEQESPIEKCGPNLIAPTETISGLKAINPHFFTLANNHILDQGEQGLYSTMDTLYKAGIKYAGAGRNLDEASKGFVKEINGIRLGIYCCVEHEFSIATENSAGANPFDPLVSLDHISTLKNESDYVIVLYHGGKEHYRYPSPYLQKVCRKIVDKGADLVVCQHSHCIGCEEKWNGGTIVYGQGNFLFDHSESEFWQTGVLIELTLAAEGGYVSYVPLRKNNSVVRLDKEGGEKTLCQYKERSKDITRDGLIEKKYSEFAEQMLYQYLAAIQGNRCRTLVYRILNKMTSHRFERHYMHHVYKNYGWILKLVNCIECEAHRELFLKGLGGWKR